MTHPGVGPLTALAYVLIIRTPERFPCDKQLGSYVGMIPSEDSSAAKQRLGHISKQGNSLLRFLLVEAAQAAGCGGTNVSIRRRWSSVRTWDSSVPDMVSKHRPHDWASRSLQREFEEVIMVEVTIEEMHRSD
jgi:Transposase IS116/IS110/IS902 family